MFNVEELKKQVYRCTRCGWCRASPNIVCPIYESDLPWEHNTPRGKISIARGVLESQLKVTDELVRDVFTCTSCSNCREHCLSYHPYKSGVVSGKPVIDPVETIELFKAYVVEEGGALPVHQNLFAHIKRVGNPFGEAAEKRTDFLDEFKKKEAEVVYFVGCMSSYRMRQIAHATATILQKVADFTILENEVCCGSVLLRTGQIKSISELIQVNLEQINNTGALSVVFSCPGCYMTFSRDYPKFGAKLEFQPIHISEFVLDNLNGFQLSSIETKATYHDPCHLGRACQIYEAPREVLKTVCTNFIELKTSREDAKCCGAGGGMRSAYPDIADKLAFARLKEVTNTGSRLLVSACPFCEYQFIVTASNHNINIEVKDFTEVLVESIREQSL
ncbi:MAG: (Fe-S)-binding protein [Candidatus Heimdallarchaeota archaeon]